MLFHPKKWFAIFLGVGVQSISYQAEKMSRPKEAEVHRLPFMFAKFCNIFLQFFSK